MHDVPFVYLFKTENNFYAFDVNSSDIVILEELVFDVLNLLVSGLHDSEIPTILKEQYPVDRVKESLKTIRELQNEDVLFSANHPEIISYGCCKSAYENLYNHYLQQITLDVTQKCNLRCRYCVYSGNYPNERCHSNKDMSWSTAKKAIDYMIEHGGHEKNPFIGRENADRDFTIGFYGGEPLLRMDLINRCVNYVKENLSNDRTCTFTVTTNRTLLNPSTVKFLLDNKISVSVSLDGPQPIHDRSRIFPNGSGTHEKVIEGIQNLQNYAAFLKPTIPFYGIINVCLIGDVDVRDLWVYFTSLESLLNTNYMKFSFMFTTVKGGLESWNIIYGEDVIGHPIGWSELVEKYKNACLDGVYKDVNKPLEWRMNILQDFARSSLYFDVWGRTRYQHKKNSLIPKRIHPGSICLPGARRAFVSVEGTILPCERVSSDDPYYTIGSISEGINVEKAVQLLEDFTEPSREDCKNCWIIRMCHVGCVRDIVKNGVPKPDLKIKKCIEARRNRAEEIVNMCVLLEKDPHALDHFNDVSVS